MSLIFPGRLVPITDLLQKMNNAQKDFFSLSLSELAEIIGGTGRAKEAWALVREGEDPVVSESLSKKVRKILKQDFRLKPASIDKRLVAECKTIKLRIKLNAGGYVETVIIPNPKRTTVCVSTQLGCARGCVFCATGKMGLVRQLSTAEIVFQLNLAQRELAARSMAPAGNIVFMGMGEPLDNFSAVEKAISIIIDPHAWSIPARRITVSTVGPSPQSILRASKLPTHLAWSLHAADDHIRKMLIPKAKFEVTELKRAFAQVVQSGQNKLLVELAMIKDINDRDDDIERLMVFLDDLKDDVRINLLPLNPGAGDFEASSSERVYVLKKRLQNAGFFCETRRARGLEIKAACGQLV
jgi:23S rRNA (adenine2503-C2)-methyltransferase